jgi:serine/threonine protein kinase
MPFEFEADQKIIAGNVSYCIAEHPAAPGIPYGQAGRQATVYQLVAPDGVKRALKVFKPRYRLPALEGLTNKLAPFAHLPGLTVCRRTVLVPQRHADLLRQHPDLTYAVLMPWIEGPTWTEVLLDKRTLSPDESLLLARSLAEVLAMMEQHGLAHCDLSGPNILLPALVSKEPGPQGDERVEQHLESPV